MKFISKMMIAIGTVNIILSLIQGFMIPEEYQVDLAATAREYFLLSAVIFVVGLRMLQRANQLEQEFEK